MKFDRSMLLLYAITDRAWTGNETLEDQVEKALKGGATMIQLREKKRDEMGSEYEAEAVVIRDLCRKYEVPFIINDDVELAAKIDADGVHLGQSDMSPAKARLILGSDKIIGVTAKTVQQAQAAKDAGADYVGSGAVFGSATKKDTSKLDHRVLDDIGREVGIPVVAIGGITGENMFDLKGRKIDGFAVVSAIFGADDIEGETVLLRKQAEEILGLKKG